MEPTKVAVRMGRYFGRIEPGTIGDGPFEWYPVKFDRKDTNDPNTHFTMTSPDNNRLMLQHDATGSALGADATEYGTDICGQFYGKPDVTASDWGGYEAWDYYKLEDKPIKIAVVTYDRDGAQYTSSNVTVVDL